MATEVIRVVDPDMGTGYNYDSLADWESDLGDTTSGDLPAYGEIAVAKCRCTGGTADSEWVQIDGFVTDSSYYIKIWTDPAESYRHSGKWETGNKYRIQNSEEAIFLTYEENIRFDGIMIRNDANISYRQGICFGFLNTSLADIRISNCVIRGSGSGAGINDNNLAGNYNPSSEIRVWNNIIYNFNGGWGGAIYITSQNANHYIYNNTFANCLAGLDYGYAGADDCLAKNNIIYNCTTNAAGTFAAGTGYNATDDASIGYTVTGGATGDHTSHTFSFMDADNGDFHLQSTDVGAKGLGVNLYNDANLPFQTDIDGDDRGGSGAEWDIGADEYVSSLVLNQYSFRFRNDDGDEDEATWKAAENTNIYIE